MNLEDKKKIVLDLIGTFQTASKLSLSLRKKGLKETIKEDNTPCLLYTSPSPRDLSTSRMPSSA